MSSWKVAVEPTRTAVRMLATSPESHEVLKALLPPRPHHPRALLTVLEGLALWVGYPLTVAVCASESAHLQCADNLFGNGLLPVDSALVRFDLLEPVRRRRTIAGIGDFRQLRLQLRRAP